MASATGKLIGTGSSSPRPRSDSTRASLGDELISGAIQIESTNAAATGEADVYGGWGRRSRSSLAEKGDQLNLPVVRRRGCFPPGLDASPRRSNCPCRFRELGSLGPRKRF